ncbi:MAG: O-methyltransferase [Ignavibacteria bacterium]|nr:O-methyltransferase [Ignavibacteria bacterium]
MKTVVMTEELYAYIEDLYAPQEKIFKDLFEETERLGIPMIQISPDQGKFLYMLARMLGAKYALEIGTLTGYSAIHIAKGLAQGGMLTTVDIERKHSEVAEKYFEKAGVADRTTAVTSGAIDFMNALAVEGRKFDLVFIDADKTGYKAYYELALTLSHSGTVIILDNMLKGGRVTDTSESDPDLDAIREMNEFIPNDGRVESLLMTIGDGFTLCRVI